MTSVGTNTLPSILSKEFADVPIMIGSNANEFRIFLAVLGLAPTASTNLPALVSDLLGLNISSIEEPIMDLYTGGQALTFEIIAQ